MKCFIPGGSSAPILMPDDLDVQLAVETVAAAGSMAGSGAVIVIDDRTSMVHLALRVADFYRHESCGKCTPCREGTRWMVELLKRVASGEARDARDRPAGRDVRPHRGQVPVPARRRLRDAGALVPEALPAPSSRPRVGVGVPESVSAPFGALYPELKRTLPLVPA